MIHAFDRFELDTDRGELRRDGVVIDVEPQVFAVLVHLIANRDRLVSKDDLVAEIWGGRIVSDSAISSRIKSARQAIGDDGKTQRFIRTLHGSGFRFVGEVDARVGISVADALKPERPPGERPSIAVMPFSLNGQPGQYGWLADAVPHDLITELSRLRWLFVIARGSSFQFRESKVSAEKVGETLGVRYCLTGAAEVGNGKVAISVELIRTRDNAVIWGERYAGDTGHVHEIRAGIVHAVVNALELQIPVSEAMRALKSSESLDAWSAYHLGVQQMYRFSREGNEQAAGHFRKAISLDPAFARAHAGLSFALFGNAFMHVVDDVGEAAALARRHAEEGLTLDPLDPFCNLVMGRALWLGRDLEASVPWLDRAIELNPNYAQAKYSRAWTETLLGEAKTGVTRSEEARMLSPLDPLLYGFIGVKALAYIVLDQPIEAAVWAERAARAPRAHALIELIAAVSYELAEDHLKAASWAASARRRQPGLSASDFLHAFPFRGPDERRRVLRALERLDLDSSR